MNDRIKAPEVRLIDYDGEQVGIIPLEEALERAEDAGLDLIEVAPKATPPVCRVLDYGKMKYEEKKKAHQSKKKQHVVKIKEVRVRPRIDEHDLMTKINHGKQFLKDGCKLKVTLMYRGRELARTDLGDLVMERVIDLLDEVAEVEKRNPLEGRRMSIMFNPR